MFKRIMSVMLAVVMLMSVAMVAASAAQVEIADNSADAVADVAADGSADTGAEGDSAETGSAHALHFDVNSANWNNFKKVHCYIWEYGTDNKLTNWQEKKNQCKDDDGDGIWTFDLDAKGLALNDGVLYCVIFSNDVGMQTYDLLFDTSVFGDTARCNGNSYENPADSNKTAYEAVWDGQDASKFGPVMGITSIGSVVGTCIPSNASPQSMFENFLKETLLNAREFSGKDDQTLLDDTAKALGLQQDDVEAAIKNTGVEVKWEKSKSSLESGSNPNATTTGDGSSTGGGASNNNSNSSSSNTKTGSGSTTKTGQETTVLFIMLGVMIAAAGVVVLSRKERA